jgi:hypothetical protein
MDNDKVLPSRKVAARLGEIGGYPQRNPEPNPSQRNLNKPPAEPPRWGMDGGGKKPPYFPK